MVKQKLYMSVTDELREFLLPIMGQDKVPKCIEIDELYTAVVNYNQKNCETKTVNINDLLKNSRIMYRSTEPSEERTGNLSELELMRRRADERKYQKSIANIKLGGGSGLGKSGAVSDVKSASESISFASHFIFAFASSFLLGYYFAEYGLGLTNDSHKYIAGGAASFLTLIIESLLFIIREEKRTRSPKKASKRVPLRESIEQTVTESPLGTPSDKTQESIRNRQRK